ncbi:peptidyl-prolyl cis-trans isomerase FKBP19, chloroplastic-like [Aristolochia californica]|uniref:peptidyl-prolyl cis-trans isomerase FKBP19, chloroplastic-like n=1 Tax=Aristolochia californica TaxID=171875 RepID=UPI0035DD9682
MTMGIELACTAWEELWEDQNAVSRLHRNKLGSSVQGLAVGSGPIPKNGETVVVDWDGYTIGYYGRIFEARNKTKGGSFEGDDKDFFKFTLGSQQVIPAFEEAVQGMAMGGIRRIIVPPDLGYPDNDFNKLGPRPIFLGQRASDLC